MGNGCAVYAISPPSSQNAAPYLRPEFVGSVAGILNVAYGYASGADSSPSAQDTNLTPLGMRSSTSPWGRLRVQRSGAKIAAVRLMLLRGKK